MRRAATLAMLAGLLALAAPAPALPLEPEPRAPQVHHVHMTTIPGAFVYLDDGTGAPLSVVRPGDAVEFHSHGVLCHTATAGTTTEAEPVEGLMPPGVGLNAFDTGLLCPGEARQVTLPAAGEFAYYCAVSIHRWVGMRGAVVVRG